MILENLYICRYSILISCEAQYKKNLAQNDLYDSRESLYI